ncbi:MAG: phosphodiester glycosidase family protein [Oscillospiraceae bacterium]|nr:phosphodiester glycosidase family protein [Oscillospiraceae bacterium]
MTKQTGLRALVIALAVLGVLAGTLLVIANRYWFEHPQPVPSQPVIERLTPAPLPRETEPPRETPSPHETASPPEPTPEPTPTPRPEPLITGGVLLDTHEDDAVTVHLRRFETGEGQARVTYFTAEAIVLDMSRIGTGFAKDTFGRNIQERPSSMARRLGALLAVNGDYYGFRDDGIIIRNGTLYRDEPSREGMAFLADGRMMIYQEQDIPAAELLAMGALHTFSFGPALLRDGEAPDAYSHGISGLNPRTAVGMIAPGHFVFLVADGRLKGYSQGLTLRQMSELFAELGCTDAYNLDGGGTSTLVWREELANRPQGRTSERASSDILYISEN